MAGEEIDWDGLRLLLDVSDVGSFLRAGERNGIAASTVSRRISALEAMLGARLVERGTDGVRLTAQGVRLTEIARSTARQVLHFRSSQSFEFEGAVIVSVSDGFTAVAVEAARSFSARHPKCVVELRVETNFARISRGDADVAIRTAHRGEPALVYRKIATLSYGIFCSHTLHNTLDTSAPNVVPVVGMTPPFDGTPPHRSAMEAGLSNVRLRSTSFAAQLEAVRSGVGVAALPRVTAQGLLEVFHELRLPDEDVYVVTRSSSANEAHIKAFVDILVDGIRSAVERWNSSGFSGGSKT